MDQKIQYKSCSTGLLTELSSTRKDPKLINKWTGGEYGLGQVEEVFLRYDDTNYPFSQMIHGAYQNLMQGGPFVPNGILQGKESYLSAAVVGASSANFTPTSHRNAAGELIWVTDAYYLVTDRRVPEADALNWESAPYNGEIIQLGTYTADTNPVDLNGATTFANSHPEWAVIQPIVPVPASYDTSLGQYGVVYQLEQPTQISTCTGVDGTSQTIDVTFTASSDVAVEAYAVAILKSGDGYSQYAAPVAVPEWVCPSDYGSDKVALWAADGTAVASGGTNLTDNGDGTWTTPSIDTYWKITTAHPGVVTAKQAIVAGTYYAVVWAFTNIWIASNVFYLTEKSRMSDPKISAAITVA